MSWPCRYPRILRERRIKFSVSHCFKTEKIRNSSSRQLGETRLPGGLPDMRLVNGRH